MAKEKVKRASAASVHAVGPQGMGGWVRWQGSRPELREGGVALEGLGERHATLGAELVAVEPAQTAKENSEEGQCSERACCGAARHGRVGSMAGQQTGAP